MAEGPLDSLKMSPPIDGLSRKMELKVFGKSPVLNRVKNDEDRSGGISLCYE